MQQRDSEAQICVAQGVYTADSFAPGEHSGCAGGWESSVTTTVHVPLRKPAEFVIVTLTSPSCTSVMEDHSASTAWQLPAPPCVTVNEPRRKPGLTAASGA